MSALERAASSVEAHEPPEARGSGRDDVALLVADRADGSLAHRALPRPARDPPRRATCSSSTPRRRCRRPAASARTAGRLELHLSTPARRRDLGGRAANRDAARRAAAAAGRDAARAARRRPAPSSSRRTPASARSGGRTARARRAARAVPRRHGRPIRYATSRAELAARRVPDRVRLRAGQRRDAERRPAVHGRARDASSSRAASSSRRSRCTRASPRRSSASRPTPSASRCPRRPRASSTRCAVGRPGDRRRHDGRPRARDGGRRPTARSRPAPAGRASSSPRSAASRAIDGLLTGWHEPRSSHLQMLEAVAGRELLERSYREARAHGYRWHEFGDLHLILG